MTVKSGQALSGLVVTKDSTGALATPSVGPAGTVYVNGVSNAATVTVTGSNPYKWSVTLPTLAAGDMVSVYITATISSVATAAVVFEDQADTKCVSDLNDAAAAPSAATVASQVRTELTTELARIDTNIGSRSSHTAANVRTEMDANSTKLANLDATMSSRLASASYTAPDNTSITAIKAKTDNLPASPAAVGSAMTLTGAYDAAKSAASQASVDAVAGYVDTEIASIISSLNTVLTRLTSQRASNLDYLTATPPTAQQIEDEVLDALASAHNLANTIGARINAAGAASDPLTNNVPGSYASGTAGYILGQLLPGHLTVTSPVSEDGTEVTVIAGDDYAAADGRALLWTLPTSFTPADITGATVSFKVKHPDGTLTKTGGIVSATTPIQVKVELAAADTTGLDDGDYPFTLRVALAVSGRTITITRAGIFKVRSGL